MEFCNIDEESEIVARICCYNQSEVRSLYIYFLNLTGGTVLNIPMNDFLSIFHLNTQEIWKEIFKKYESLTWDSFFQITSIFAIYPFHLILKFMCIIFNIDYTQPITQQDVLVILKEISSDSYYNSVKKSEKIEYPIHFNSLIQLLSQQKHSYDKLHKIRQNIRNGLLSVEKFEEISERPNYIQQREEYTSQYRELPPNPCCFRITHCGRDHPTRLHYDYEVPTYNRQNVISKFLENVLIIFNPSSIKSLKSHLTFYSLPKSRSGRNSGYNNNNNNNINIPTSPISSEREITYKYNRKKSCGTGSNLGNRNSSSSNYTNNGSSKMANKYLQSQAQLQFQQQMQQQQQKQGNIGTPKGTNSSLKKSINSPKTSMNLVIDFNNKTVINKRNSVGAISVNANNGLTSPFIKSQRVIHSCKNSVNSNKENAFAGSPFEHYKRADFSPNDVNNISLYNRQMMNIASRKNKISPLMPPRPPPPVPDFC